MEIAILAVLFLVGSIAGSVQALRYIERRYSKKRRGTESRPNDDD